MADLRDRFRSLDRMTPPDLWPEVERRAAIAAQMAAQMADPQPVAAGPTTWRRVDDLHGSRRLVLAMVLLGLAVALVVGATLGGALVREPLRADVPPAVVEASEPPAMATPRPEPTSGRSSDWWRIGSRDAAFASTMYDYSILLPTYWETESATTTWSGLGAWDVAPAADLLIRPQDVSCDQNSVETVGREPIECSLSVVAMPVVEGADIGEWVAANVPERDVVERDLSTGTAICAGVPLESGERSVVAAALARWEPGMIGGHPARIRAQCGFLDGATIVGERAYLFSMYLGLQSGGERRALEGVTSTLTFGVDIPKQRPPADWWDLEPRPRQFSSTLYHYSIHLPGYWKTEAATRAWTGSGEWDVAPTADILTRPQALECPSPSHAGLAGEPDECSLAVVATTIEKGTDLVEWIARNVPERDVVVGTSCEAGGDGADWHGQAGPGHVHAWGEAAPETWVEGEIGHRPARIRAQCGFVDGVVIVGERAYIFSMFQGLQAGGDPAPLEGVTETVEFRD